MAEFKKDPDELGCLWEKTIPRGPYMTGLVNGEPVVVFKIANKRSGKAPDWRILKAKPKAAKASTDEEPPF